MPIRYLIAICTSLLCAVPALAQPCTRSVFTIDHVQAVQFSAAATQPSFTPTDPITEGWGSVPAPLPGQDMLASLDSLTDQSSVVCVAYVTMHGQMVVGQVKRSEIRAGSVPDVVINRAVWFKNDAMIVMSRVEGRKATQYDFAGAVAGGDAGPLLLPGLGFSAEIAAAAFPHSLPVLRAGRVLAGEVHYLHAEPRSEPICAQAQILRSLMLFQATGDCPGSHAPLNGLYQRLGDDY